MSHLLSLLLILSTTTASATDWLQFRGHQASSTQPDSPITLPPQPTPAWEISLPGRGLSSPLVIGEKIIVTAASGPEQNTLHILCFNSADGSTLWERTFRATGRTMSHKKTNVAAPTPCSDGQTIFAYFSSNDLFAFDLDGNLKWLRGLMLDYPNASNSLGMASSPVVHGSTLIIQSENDSQSLALGIDTATGLNRWLLERPKAANWTSPVILDELVALQSSKGITGIHPATGNIAWDYADGASTIPSSTIRQNVLYVPSHGITALELSADATSQKWRNDKLKPGTASPIVHQQALYILNSAGVLIRADLENGDETWKLRVKGPISATPLASADHLYIVSEQGLLQVVKTQTDGGEITYDLDLKDTILATPSASHTALYLRSDSKLWKLH
jgi:outer membrane protein assembly factor BamB